MARKRYSDEDILKLLREIEVHLHDGTDFSGKVSADDALKAEFGLTEANGDYSGTFYGTEADAIGGVFSGTSESAAGNKSNWVGGFVSN